MSSKAAAAECLGIRNVLAVSLHCVNEKQVTKTAVVAVGDSVCSRSTMKRENCLIHFGIMARRSVLLSIHGAMDLKIRKEKFARKSTQHEWLLECSCSLSK